jgi:hypothetical protein
MKAALKVLNDYLRKSPITSVPHHLKNATNIVQQEWFKVQTCSELTVLTINYLYFGGCVWNFLLRGQLL